MKGLAGGSGDLFAPLNFAERRKRLIWGRSFSDTTTRNGKDFLQSICLISGSLRWFTLEMSQEASQKGEFPSFQVGRDALVTE